MVGSMTKKPLITDADFEVVDGPYRVGDENREKRGWYLTDKIGKRGEALWYRPPGLISKWIRRIGLTVYASIFIFGIAIALIMGV
jgi:hypothetical protein